MHFYMDNKDSLEEYFWETKIFMSITITNSSLYINQIKLSCI